MTEIHYARFKKVVTGSLDEVEGEVRDALASEGFGVLTEIDVSVPTKKA